MFKGRYCFPLSPRIVNNCQSSKVDKDDQFMRILSSGLSVKRTDFDFLLENNSLAYALKIFE
jgi:hypothetical protein